MKTVNVNDYWYYDLRYAKNCVTLFRVMAFNDKYIILYNWRYGLIQLGTDYFLYAAVKSPKVYKKCKTLRESWGSFKEWVDTISPL